MWLLAGQSNASGMGDRRSSLKYTVPVCFDYVQTGDSLRVLQDPVGENGKFFGKANSGSIAPSFAWHLNKLTGDSVAMVSVARGGSACSTEGETIYGTWAEKGTLPLFGAAVEKCRKAQRLTRAEIQRCDLVAGRARFERRECRVHDRADYERASKTSLPGSVGNWGLICPFTSCSRGSTSTVPRRVSSRCGLRSAVSPQPFR
ncbi:MAG: hypothetical protein V8Q54_09270, partial [Alistipes senegalensis]